MTQSLSDFDILSRLPRSPEKRSTQELLSRLTAAGHEITVRSLQRRLISLAARYPVACDDRNKPFGWSITTDQRMAMGELSVQEAVALKLSERYLADVMPSDVLDDLKPHFEQANAKLRHASLYAAWLNKVRVIPTTQPLARPRIARNIHARACEGVLKGVVLNVTYKGAASERAKASSIYPLAIVARGSTSYLLAKNPRFSDGDNIVWFALHRFQSIEVTEQLAPSEDFDIDLHISQSSLGFPTTGNETLRVVFYEGAGKHLADSPIAVDQTLKVIDAKTSELQARLSITEQLKWWLLGFGDLAEVIAPSYLRKEFHARLVAAESRYCKKARI